MATTDNALCCAVQAIEHADGRPGARPEQPHTFCLVPVPQSQPVLPCLLRRQLQHAHFRSARRLARLHQHGPHFSRSLEWLLFTSLDFDYSEGDVESVASGAHPAAASARRLSTISAIVRPR